jgi:hypothetical protein
MFRLGILVGMSLTIPLTIEELSSREDGTDADSVEKLVDGLGNVVYIKIQILVHPYIQIPYRKEILCMKSFWRESERSQIDILVSHSFWW